MNKLIFSILVLVSFDSYAQKANVSSEHLNLNKKDVAVNGYDPVSYFDKQPLKGKSSINFNLDDVTYYFENEVNKNKFMKSSDKFVPQFGGWCAYAMSMRGEKMEVDPKTYKITNGKLYLFYDSFFSSVIDDWIDDELVLIDKGNQNWNNIIKD